MVESGFIEIELDKIIYILEEIYRILNTSEKIFNEKYCELLKCIGNQNAIIGGDFNIDYLQPLQHKRLEELYNINVNAQYILSITLLTRVTHNSCTLIENIHVKDKSLSRYYAGILVDDISDHFSCLLSLQLKMSPNKESPLYKFTRSINDEKTFAMDNELLYKDWTHLLDYDIDDSYAKLSEEITIVLNKDLPLVLKRIQPRDICRKRWMTKALLKSSKKLKRYYCASLSLSKDDEKYRKYIRY